MTQHYQSPGVYVEEVPSAVKPIAGVGTSTAAFIGVFDYNNVKIPAPVKDKPDEIVDIEVKPVEPIEAGTPKLITNWERFVRHYGDFVGAEQAGGAAAVGEDTSKFRYLAHAVYGFFLNGGTRCYVIQVNSTTDVPAALSDLAKVDEVALVAIPGHTDQANQSHVIDHCEREHLQDRFAILDGIHDPENFVKSEIVEAKDSNYAAIYFPWTKVFDPGQNLRDLNKDPKGDGGIYVPPSGHVAGVYARVDTTRGVHKAPANEVVRGALDVEYRLSREDQAGLNPDGVNVIRRFNGNIKIWGARTIGGDANTEWKYINVRRLFLFLRESIDEGTQWIVFEPNEPDLWAKIRRNITAFLTLVWGNGALFGATPQEAFYVKCDEETNPQEVRDQGRVVTEIGVAVVKPAEFVIFRISQWAGPPGGP
jgi:phage tail sheath protein FI